MVSVLEMNDREKVWFENQLIQFMDRGKRIEYNSSCSTYTFYYTTDNENVVIVNPIHKLKPILINPNPTMKKTNAQLTAEVKKLSEENACMLHELRKTKEYRDVIIKKTVEQEEVINKLKIESSGMPRTLNQPMTNGQIIEAISVLKSVSESAYSTNGTLMRSANRKIEQLINLL